MVALIPSGLFTILRRVRSEPRTPEAMYRSFLLSKILAHMDEYRDELGARWALFAEELRIRLEPVTSCPISEVTLKDMYNAADAIIDQWKACADISKQVVSLLGVVDDLLPKLTLPNDYRIKQDFLTIFHRLSDWLAKDEENRSLMSDSPSMISDSRSSSGSSAGVSGGSTNGDSPPGYMEVPVWFATCRRPTGAASTEAFFGTERGEKLSVGIVKVSIPDTDGVAQKRQELPYFWYWDKFRASNQSRKAVLVGKCLELSEEFMQYHVTRFMNRVGVGRREACVYVHGFNNRFTKAAKKMALCGYKMQADVPLFMFSWPSFQSVDRYSADEGNAMWAVQYLIDFLWMMLTECELEKVHLIAHSMGSRIVLYALARLGERVFPKGAGKLGRLVLAAPDFDLGEFYLMQDHLSKTVEHVTIYSSANDQALHVSKRIHGGHPRLGEFPVNVGAKPWHMPFAENIDLIDATGLDRSVIGHGYVFSHAGVLQDACDFLWRGRPAEKRPAVKGMALPGGFRYYTFQGISETPSAIEAIEEIDDEGDDEMAM